MDVPYVDDDHRPFGDDVPLVYVLFCRRVGYSEGRWGGAPTLRKRVLPGILTMGLADYNGRCVFLSSSRLRRQRDKPPQPPMQNKQSM